MVSLPPVLLIAFPLFFAFLAPLINMVSKKAVKYYTMAVLLLNTAISLIIFLNVLEHGVIYEELSGFYPPVGILLSVGYLGAILALLINALAPIVYLSYFGDAENSVKFSMIYMLVTASSTGIVITGDLFNMFVFFEITAVGSYGLVASMRTKKAYEGAFKYIVLGTIGSSFILLGIATIYGYLKTLNFYDIAARINTMPESARLMSFIFLIIGIGVEAELFPLNGWVPDAYEGASNRVAAFFSLGPSKAGIYAIARLLFTLVPLVKGFNLAMLLGLLTLVIGELAALRQKDPKRMLAYSSIGQMGLILVAFSMHSALAFTAAIFLMVSHALAKSLLFLGTRGYKEGVLRNPWVAGPIFIGVLSIIGMPPFPGFWGKWYLLVNMAQRGFWAVILLIIFAAIVEGVYYARFLHRGTEGEESKVLTRSEIAAITILALILVLVGMFPQYLYTPAVKAAAALMGGGP
ncbi:MAG: NADH-quinone oxidoreductase subunit F [Euryarchaeota archaeon]|nr:NADH-quinone oxidoreductase subunit F [Euryarchaeota archaeon]